MEGGGSRVFQDTTESEWKMCSFHCNWVKVKVKVKLSLCFLT